MSGAIKLKGAGFESDFKAEVSALQAIARETGKVNDLIQGLIEDHASPQGRRAAGAQGMIVKLAEQLISGRQAQIAAVKGVHGIKKDVIERRIKTTVKELELNGEAQNTDSAVTHRLLDMLQRELQRNVPGTGGGPVIDAEFEEVDADSLIDQRLGALPAPAAKAEEEPPSEAEEGSGSEEAKAGDTIADPEGNLWRVGEDGVAEPLPGTAKIFQDPDGVYYGVLDGERIPVYDIES